MLEKIGNLATLEDRTDAFVRTISGTISHIPNCVRDLCRYFHADLPCFRADAID